MPAETFALTSTALLSGTYDSDKQELTVRFHNGREYTHPGVPPNVAAGLQYATSPGTFYNEQIKGVYV